MVDDLIKNTKIQKLKFLFTELQVSRLIRNLPVKLQLDDLPLEMKLGVLYL